MTLVESWGRQPAVRQRAVEVGPDVSGRDLASHPSVLAFGRGHSYGDVCLNPGGALLSTRRLDRILAFDVSAGTVVCEPGVTLEALIERVQPAGWFPPVLPGTKHVTLGGAVASDVHGKNHAREGSFGHHVRALELLRSSGERLACAPGRNGELFRATIGGLGLTGLVTRMELGLRRAASACFDAEYVKLARFEEFFRELPETEARFEHAAAWLDGLDRGVRGILGRANRAESGARRPRPPSLTFPCTAPAALLTDASVGLFNRLVWRRQREAVARRVVHQDAILFPEDRLLRWNRAFGLRGILEYHALFPRGEAQEAVGELFERVFASRERFYIGVLKGFGDRARAGFLSFARAGVSVAMNFPFRGDRTLRLLDELDRVLVRRRGVLYLAKDARMPPSVFRAVYPEAVAFAGFVDPRFSSGLWRRVRA